MVSCPRCERDGFASDRSMRHHHSIVHNSNLPNSKCNDCGEQFYSDSGSRKYCDECLSFSGKDNPMYDDKKETTTCNICESEFTYYPSDKKGLYCPICVEEENWRDIPETKGGEENPLYNRVTRNCSQCGEVFEIRKHKISENNYCSKECHIDNLKKNQFGEDNPNYKSGEYKSSKFYQGDWHQVRRDCIERDNGKCQKCGDEETTIDVHHIKPVREFDNSNDAHTLDNVICLCRPCHMSVDHGDESIPKDLSSLNSNT